MGAVDVVVTDGFTGNVALKTAEGTARLVASYVREALTSGVISKVGAALASSGLKRLRERMDPSNVNGGVLLGLNGVVVKSHAGELPVGWGFGHSCAAHAETNGSRPGGRLVGFRSDPDRYDGLLQFPGSRDAISVVKTGIYGPARGLQSCFNRIDNLSQTGAGDGVKYAYISSGTQRYQGV